MATRLAVYGTLMPGETNDHVLDGVEGHWSRGTVRGRRHADGWHGYPGVVLDPTGGHVLVAVLDAPGLAEHLGRLDEFEGAGYRRTTTGVVTDRGEVTAWIYVLADESHGA